MKKLENSQTSNAEMVTISRAEYENLQAQSKRVSELESRVDVLLMEALRLAQHKWFGTPSEKSDDRLMEQLSFLFNEAEVFSAVKEEEDTTVVAAHKRHKKHEYPLDSSPVGVQRIRKHSSRDSRDISIRTVMPDNMIWARMSRWWAAGLMRGEMKSLPKGKAKGCSAYQGSGLLRSAVRH